MNALKGTELAWLRCCAQGNSSAILYCIWLRVKQHATILYEQEDTNPTGDLLAGALLDRLSDRLCMNGCVTLHEWLRS